MRLRYLGVGRTNVSRLAAAGLCALAVSCAGAAWFAAQSLRDPLADSPPDDVRAWRPPIFSLDMVNGSKKARPDEATLARPVFFKSRRPFGGPERPAAAAAASPPPAGLSLRAVVGFGGETRIFLVAPAFAEGKWFAVGETLDGWTIKEASEGVVTLRNGERTSKLEFNYDNAGKGDAPLRSPPPPPPPAVEAPPPNMIRGRRERPA